MKKSLFALFLVVAMSISSVTGQVGTASPQSSGPTFKTSSKILYHNGPVLTATQNLYFVFYGCWGMCSAPFGDPAIEYVLVDFGVTIGNSPYSRINSTYTNASGQPAANAFIFGGIAYDRTYSHGVDLTQTDIAGIISDKINSFQLPQDPNGLYVVMASGDIASTATGFCSQGVPPFHGTGIVNGNFLNYIFLGDPARCPLVASPAGYSSVTPNGSFAADAMAANLAHALNGSMTDPLGTGWYDRYGLENADKCARTFGTVYTTANGALANVRLGARDFLLEQNWSNGRHAGCALN